MTSNHINKYLRDFLNKIFCVVGANSPYKLDDFVGVLLDAVEHTDFTNNTCVRINGPTGETVFSRLKDVNFNKIKNAFYSVLKSIFSLVKASLRNRKVALAFDITDEPYYGKLKGLWIHPQKPVQGSTGCFKFLTVSCTDRDNKFILGSLPVFIGANITKLVMELLQKAQEFIHIEAVLFDRGFDDYSLLDALQDVGLKYQILWRKHEWADKIFSTMKDEELKEVTRHASYRKHSIKHKLEIRFVLIKQYKRYKDSKAYDWVFATNTQYKTKSLYIDKYRKRWNIETTFRVLDNIQIKTTTKNKVIRYFINMFCCLVYNLWKLAKLLGSDFTLKNFVAAITRRVMGFLRVQHLSNTLFGVLHF